ncbi:MAG TPA: OmpA family protein [Saprospiraceae bacterium]|nr:OmpA family protein [Saprospiraceae bacterium]
MHLSFENDTKLRNKILQAGSILLISFLLACSRNEYKLALKAQEAKQYAIAKSYFVRVYKKNPSPQMALKIAKICALQSKYKEELIWAKKATEHEDHPENMLAYAFALMKNEDYETAGDVFSLLAKENKDNVLIRKQITTCKLLSEWKKQKLNPSFDLSIAEPINSKYNDFSVCYLDSLKFVFCSDRVNSKADALYAWNNNAFFDLYTASKIEMNPSVFDNVNSSFHEGPASYSKKNNTLYYSICDAESQTETFCKLYSSQLSKNSKDNQELVLFGEELCNDIHPAIHYSDSILVFSSDRKNGTGKYDLYISYKINEQWTSAQNLGTLINTEGDEKFPVWHHDTLFFSSNGLFGFGGLDVFKTYRLENGKWANPINLKTPINSGADDFSLVFDEDYKANDTILAQGFLSSNRDGQNDDNIYRFQLVNKKDVVRPKKNKLKQMVELLFFEAKEYNNLTIERKRIDSVYITDEKKNQLFTGAKSNIMFWVGSGEKFQWTFSKKSYLNQKMSFNTYLDTFLLVSDSVITHRIEIELVPYDESKQFVIQDIYYDFDDSKLRPDSYGSLEKLFNLLEANPKMIVTLGAHTDCRGTDEYNLELSQKRAESVSNYLSDRGVPRYRMISLGYGKSDLLEKCICNQCLEQQHQLNRRTTFKFQLKWR